MPAPFNVAIIGYGFSAKIFHIPLLSPIPSLHLYGIVQRSPTPSTSCLLDHPAIKTWTTTDEMLADPNVDLVIVTTLPTSHVELATAALQAGKHVVVEKPFTPTSAEAYALCGLAKEKGKLLSVYQNRRWDADFATVAHLVKEGTLGRVVEFHTHFDRYAPDKSPPSIGQIYDLGTHLLDQVVLLFGVPQSGFAVIGNQREGADEKDDAGDSFSVMLRYESGLVVSVKASGVSCEEEQARFWVRGDKGSWRKGCLDVQEEQLKEGIKADDTRFGREPEERYGVLTKAVAGVPRREVWKGVEPPTWVEYYRAMARAVAGEGEVPVKGEDAARVIGMIEKLKESSATGMAVKF